MTTATHLINAETQTPQSANEVPKETVGHSSQMAYALVDHIPSAAVQNGCGESINSVLRDHQQALPASEWDESCRIRIADLHVWVDRMVGESGFKLDIPHPALAIEKLPTRRYGHYRPARNGFGLLNEISLNRIHSAYRPYWQTLGTLCHELIHEWQKYHSKTSKYRPHNRLFRDKAAELGLLVSSRGVTAYAPGNTPFLSLLRRHGVEVSDEEVTAHRNSIAERQARLNTSKLKLYMCPCGVRVRVGRSEFRAKCLDCGGVFVVQ